MIDLTCWGCGWTGHVPDLYAGRRVSCKRCGTENMAPAPATQEVYVAGWLAAIDPASESPTVEIDCRPLAV